MFINKFAKIDNS